MGSATLKMNRAEPGCLLKSPSFLNPLSEPSWDRKTHGEDAAPGLYAESLGTENHHHFLRGKTSAVASISSGWDSSQPEDEREVKREAWAGLGQEPAGSKPPGSARRRAGLSVSETQD